MGERKIIRRRYLFKGGVQGVGFRYTASYAAQAMNLTGWVANCWDGSVEMEIQGTSLEIAQVIQTIRHGRYIEIDEIEMKEIPVEADERSFRIRHC